MKERRKYPRIEEHLPLKVSVSDFDLVTKTINVSASGAYCSVDRPIEPMTKLNMVVLVPVKKSNKRVVKKINCGGIVVRREHIDDNGRHAWRVGIFFNDINEKDRKILTSYVNAHLKALKKKKPSLR